MNKLLLSPLSIFSFIFFFFISSIAYAGNLKQVRFTESELKALAGHYSTIVGYTYIRANGTQLTTRIKGKTVKLVKKSDGRIYPIYKVLGLIPISMGDISFSTKQVNKKFQIVMHSAKHKPQVAGEKFNPVPIPKTWRTRLGRYTAKVLKGKSGIKKIRLAIKNGVLVAFINKLKTPYPLLATSTNNLTSPSAGHNRDQPIKFMVVSKLFYLEYAQNKLELRKL
jgi:hypothetical protein